MNGKNQRNRRKNRPGPFLAAAVTTLVLVILGTITAVLLSGSYLSGEKKQTNAGVTARKETDAKGSAGKETEASRNTGSEAAREERESQGTEEIRETNETMKTDEIRETDGVRKTNFPAQAQTSPEPESPDAGTGGADRLLKEMSLHEKICQMMVVTPEALTGVDQVTAAGEVTRAAMNDYPVGGILLFAENLIDRTQTAGMISNLQQFAKERSRAGVFVSVDEEGGQVARVAQRLGTTSLSPMYEYRFSGTETARENASVIAGDIAQFGFNLDLAPVADTWSNPANQVIGERAYSDNYEDAAKLVAAAVDGFHSKNVMCTLKHFPGHGDTAEDSHTGSAYVYKTREELRSQELLPFRAGIDAGADMVMAGHITLPELDSLPASLSSTIITGLLRNEMGYDGVVITDALSMQALTDLYGFREMAVMAVAAGDDLLLCQSGMRDMVEALENAVASGEITEERIDESVGRILKLKEKYGLLQE